MIALNARQEVSSPANDRGDSDCPLGDLRFRRLLSDEDWLALPLAVRRRFSKRLTNGASAIYVGEIVETVINRFGRVFAQLARLIGGPLPTTYDAGMPSVVTVSEDMAGRGQVWTRLYARRRGFPQVIQSAKRFSGRTGLEEYVTAHIGMALTTHVEAGTLVFRSAGYFFRMGEWRLFLPAWLTPGALTVRHADCGDGRFLFVLEIDHPRFGRILEQTGVFHEAAA